MWGECAEHQGRGHHGGHGGCCGHGPGGGPGAAWRGPGQRFFRRFLTKEERIARLEEYLQQLQLEAKAVQEHIDELKKTG